MPVKLKQLFVIILAIVLFLCCGCSGSKQVESIYAYSMFSHKLLEIPVKSKAALTGALESGGYVTFKSKKDLEQLYSTIISNNDLKAEKYENSILIKINNGEYTDHYYLGHVEDDIYLFCGMRSTLYTDIDSSGNKSSFYLLLPLHLISDVSIKSSHYPQIYINVEYELDGDLQGIKDFYDESGWYEITSNDSEIVISGYKNFDDVFFESGGYNGDLTKLEINSPYHIRAVNYDGKNFFSVSLD